MIFGKFYGK
jgi:hypothetical protein